jgi:hypothetical protein
VFRCQLCWRAVPANVAAASRVVETRPREYPARPKANRFKREGREKHSDDPGGIGTEIARELMLCPDCAREEAPVEDHSGWRLRGPPVIAVAA